MRDLIRQKLENLVRLIIYTTSSVFLLIFIIFLRHQNRYMLIVSKISVLGALLVGHKLARRSFVLFILLIDFIKI